MAYKQKALATIAVFLGIMGAASTLLAVPAAVGPPELPHGFPAWYSDQDNLKLELCLDTNGKCFIDPPIAGNTFSEANGFGNEAFWWSADAVVPVSGGGEARLTLAVEAAYGGDASVADGNQISFGRVRVRVKDLTVPGDYRVTHPYGVLPFNDVVVSDAKGPIATPINYTKDVGGVNPANPATAFSGTLASDILNPGNNVTAPVPSSFLTWDTFNPDPALNDSLLRIETAPGSGIFHQYVGDNVNEHLVTGSPFGPAGNVFRLERSNGSGGWITVAETNLFIVSGKVFEPPENGLKVYTNTLTQKLSAVGPVNRVAPFVATSTANITGTDITTYPVGYPLWYSDASGLKLTITPPPMGIALPPDPNDPAQVALRTSDESFFWAASAIINDYNGITGNSAILVYGLEAAFAGDGSVVEGNQISFGRLRIRIDTATAGTYTVTHPYGTNTFIVAAADLANGINYTLDIGAVNPFDPDAVFDSALFSIIGPNFLTWDTFNRNPALNDPALIKPVDPLNPTGPKFQYVGDPATTHAITGGTNGNIFRVQGPNGLDVQTDLFTVQGQVFAQSTVVAPFNLLLLGE
jgi:hypothetical protein